LHILNPRSSVDIHLLHLILQSQLSLWSTKLLLLQSNLWTLSSRLLLLLKRILLSSLKRGSFLIRSWSSLFVVVKLSWTSLLLLIWLVVKLLLLIGFLIKLPLWIVISIHLRLHHILLRILVSHIVHLIIWNKLLSLIRILLLRIWSIITVFWSFNAFKTSNIKIFILKN